MQQSQPAIGNPFSLKDPVAKMLLPDGTQEETYKFLINNIEKGAVFVSEADQQKQST
jgi:hypothetical protein